MCAKIFKGNSGAKGLKTMRHAKEHDYWSRSSLFRDVTQRTLVVIHGRFGTVYRSHFQGSSSPRRMGCSSSTARPLNTEPIGCSETSVNNYQSTPRNIPEERGCHLHRDHARFSFNNSTDTHQREEFWYSLS